MHLWQSFQRIEPFLNNLWTYSFVTRRTLIFTLPNWTSFASKPNTNLHFNSLYSLYSPTTPIPSTHPHQPLLFSLISSSFHCFPAPVMSSLVPLWAAETTLAPNHSPNYPRHTTKSHSAIASAHSLAKPCPRRLVGSITRAAVLTTQGMWRYEATASLSNATLHV